MSERCPPPRVAAVSVLLVQRESISTCRLTPVSFPRARALTVAGNVLVVLLATSVHDYSAATLGSLFSAVVLVDLLLIYPAASLADRVSDSRTVVVPALCLQAAALCAMSYTVSQIIAAAECSSLCHMRTDSQTRSFYLSLSHTADGSLVPQGENQYLFLGTLGVWSLGAAALGPIIPAYANGVIPPAHRGLGVALFRSAGDLGFMGAPVLVGALVDATSLDVGFRGLALGVCGSAAIYAVGAVPSRRPSGGGGDSKHQKQKKTP